MTYRRDRWHTLSRSIRDAVLDEDLADHHWVPDSGRIPRRSENDLKHALWLMRLSAVTR